MEAITEALKRGLTPDPRMALSEWASKYYIVPPGSAMPGLINLKYTPYLIEPLENLSWNSPVKEEYWMKGVQLGVSTMLDIVVCGTVDYAPCPLVMFFGSDGMAGEYVKLRLEPSFENNPKLRGKITDGYDRKGKSTINLKLFEGGALKFTGGVTEKAYRSFSAAIVLMDDIDAFPRDVDAAKGRAGQGSPIDLAKDRTNARQGRYKLAVQGSPTNKETSLIYENFKNTCQRHYHVPCPFCGQLQIIDFDRIKFKFNKAGVLTEPPSLECETCNRLIPEKYKFDIMQPENGAKWVSHQESSDPLVVGRHLSSAYSLIGYSWSDMAKQFKSAADEAEMGKIRKLKVFRNQKLGIPWEDTRSKRQIIKHESLWETREDYKVVPEDGVIITCGIDVQANRIELLTAANAPNSDVYCLEAAIIGGDTTIKYGDDGSPYDKVEKYLDKKFKNCWGVEQPIMHTCIDMGFNSIYISPFLGKMQEKGHEITGVFGGTDGGKKTKDYVGKEITNKYGMVQREINVNEGKTLNYNRLKKGKIHFSKHPSFTDKFFKQLTVEKWDSEKNSWVCPDGARNEATDTLNYLTAAFYIFSENDNLDWQSFKNWNKAGCVFAETDFSVIDDGIEV